MGLLIDSRIRKSLALLSMVGMIASVIAYGLTFCGVAAERILSWTGLLCIGMMMLFVPIILLEYPNSGNPSFFYKGFATGLPGWVAPCEWVLALFALGQLIWFGLHSGLGIPAIQDGQYVIESRGQVLRVISEGEYFALRAAVVRMFAAMMGSFYFVPMTYWWFHSRGNRPNASSGR